MERIRPDADDGVLRGTSVIVAGAGLAGLSAAYELRQLGARVQVIEARNRVGGRVWTLREGFAGRQHAEAGGDLIEEGQHAIRQLASDQGLEVVPVLPNGFSFVCRGRNGDEVTPLSDPPRLWRDIRGWLDPWIRGYLLAEQRWDSAVARELSRRSVQQWLDAIGAPDDVRARLKGLRGYFLADPSDLSLLALVDELTIEDPGRRAVFRIRGGNDQLPERLARTLGEAVRLQTTLLAVSQRENGVRAAVNTAAGARSNLVADYLVVALPATVLRDVVFDPPLPVEQEQAISGLKYGAATKTLLQFKHRFWSERSNAFGSDLEVGAFWEANEEQPGDERILALLAGGSASGDTRRLMADRGIEGVVASLAWLGSTGEALLGWRSVSWDQDPWSRGGYAYFDPTYDSAWRPWLSRPHGRILFAGEHTSFEYQGYMNGAVESGLRAASEVRALAQRDEC